eukprot:3588367-Prymnesium_polylepis.1
MLVIIIRSYKRKFGRPPPSDILDLTELPGNYESVLKEEGVDFTVNPSTTNSPDVGTGRDNVRHPELQNEDVDKYYAYTRIMASLVQAKGRLEPTGEPQSVDANLIIWINDRIIKYGRSCQEQYSHIRARIVKSGNMQSVAQTAEWRALLGRRPKNDNPASENPSNTVVEDLSQTMVRFARSLARYDADIEFYDEDKNKLNAIYDKWSRNMRGGMELAARVNVAQWLTLKSEIVEKREHHWFKASEITEEREVLRAQRKLYTGECEMRSKRYTENKKRLDGRVDALPDWCKDKKLRNKADVRMSEIRYKLESSIPQENHTLMVKEYASLQDGLSQCDELGKLSHIVSTSKFEYNYAEQAVMTIDTKLRLLTNKSTLLT